MDPLDQTTETHGPLASPGGDDGPAHDTAPLPERIGRYRVVKLLGEGGFSLGVVLYELLTGRRPFRGDSASELLEQVATREARLD